MRNSCSPTTSTTLVLSLLPTQMHTRTSIHPKIESNVKPYEKRKGLVKALFGLHVYQKIKFSLRFVNRRNGNIIQLGEEKLSSVLQNVYSFSQAMAKAKSPEHPGVHFLQKDTGLLVPFWNILLQVWVSSFPSSVLCPYSLLQT